MSDEEAYDELMAHPDIDGVAVEVALDRVGTLVDLSDNLGRPDGAARALQWTEAIEKRGLPETSASLLEYFRANAWSALRHMRHTDRAVAWSWEQPELQNEILHLRKAVRHSGFERLELHRRCQVLTNLGNGLNTVGRFVDALEYWGRALANNPRFAMALGNRGNGLMQYARSLYDGGHQWLFLRFARDVFVAAVAQDAEFESPHHEVVKTQFEAHRVSLDSLLQNGPHEKIELDGHGMGESADEKAYRRWCLAHGLFLNPLNDLGTHTIAARDVLLLPSFVTKVDEPPVLIGLFNQMKQEFVSARWLYYEGIRCDDVHFSDRDVLLYNTLDYPSYSLAVEKVKSAYRAAYSLFDKIGFFLNSYWRIGLAPERVSFRRIWIDHASPGKRAVWEQFEQSENWPLRGLFWLSKDLFDREFQDVMDPDAEALSEIRNHLEHKYLKVHDMLFGVLREQGVAGPWNDNLAFSIQRADFEAKTLRVLKLVRAALIYLSLGMHIEEGRRAKAAGDAGLTFPVELDTLDDEWKQ